MRESHRDLEQLFRRVLEAMEANAPECRGLWTQLEHRLLAHLEAEERFVLPAFARIDHDRAVALLRDHGQIREQLLELGVAVDLHLIRIEQSRAFIDMLRAHAEREQGLLYRWADERLDAAALDAARRHATG